MGLGLALGTGVWSIYLGIREHKSFLFKAYDLICLGTA